MGRYRTGDFGDYALTVGRLDGWKRPDLPLRALAHAPAARLVVVGRGPEEERLRRLSRELDLDGRVRWIPEATEDELLDLYAGARIVVVAPQGEDLGYVPLEAFLSGKPVLTTDDAGGPLEFVTDGETGFVVPPRPEALGAALRLAWERKEALEVLGQRGLARASQLSWDATIARLLSAARLSLP
ncbi:MAG: glycosyltransferase family 4 protein [Acidobacteriota bacterium]|nr:glycosyltransferase family 4 protein [Acidobacteriota bacterium]